MKKMLSVIISAAIASTMLTGFAAGAESDASVPSGGGGQSVSVLSENVISTLSQLQTAFGDVQGGSYVLGGDIDVTNSGITASVTIDGGGYAINSTETSGNSTIYQNENVTSVLKNMVINGNEKPEVGIWEGAGEMQLSDVQITGYNVTTVRKAAIGAGSSGSGKQGVLTLNNVDFSGNGMYDVCISDAATVNINEGTELDRVRLQSKECTLNIGEGWSGSFEITMDSPAARVLGSVGEGADVSGITISGEGDYYVAAEEGSLVIKNDNGAVMRFDMAQKDVLHHGSGGFLYGVSEINVPSIDLLYGLKPSTLVQKAYGGLQHPTGDAVRIESAVEAAGARKMQVYLQDIYLEWPYNAPYKADGSLDVDGYVRTVEEILYNMICDKADENTDGAFLGSDGNYYVLNRERADKYSYVLFNEPDSIWYGGNLSGLEAAWKQVYEAVHAIDPEAECAGPNYSAFRESDYNNFLAYCKANNCLPEIISWHELQDNSVTNFMSNYDKIMGLVDTYYTDERPELLVNEYARFYDIGAPGGLVKWLAMFEDKNIDGCMAYWGMANSLNEMAADQNSPNSTWWVYHWYAQMTGEQRVHTYPDFAASDYYGVTAYDEDINMGYVLLGGATDGKETVYLDNMSSTALVGAGGAVNVKVYGVGYSGQVGAEYKPECIFDGAVSVEDDVLRLQISDTDEMDAYFAVLTPTDEAGGVMSDVKLSTLSYEAENATLIAGATAYGKTGWGDLATSGRSIVGSINNNGDGVEFKVNIPEDGVYDMSLFYSLQAPFVNAQTLQPDANGQNRAQGQVLPFGMKLDGGEVQTLLLDTTVTWAYKGQHHIDLELTAGEHTITFLQINGDEGSRGNLQLVASVDKIDLDRVDIESRYDFSVDMTEQTGFTYGNAARITAVAPMSGYYKITGDAEFELVKQAVDYAADAKSFSTCSVYDIEVGDTVYLSQGANTLAVTAEGLGVLDFDYISDEAAMVTADDMTIHGYNAYYKDNEYAYNGRVITGLGIGQNVAKGEKAEDNYIEFRVNASAAGMYNFGIRYANDEPAPVMQKTDGSNYVHPYNIDLVERFAQISVNGGEAETVYFRNTLSWDTFKVMDVQLALDEGENTIRIYNDNSYQFSTIVNSTAPDIDSVAICSVNYGGGEVEVMTTVEAGVDCELLDSLIKKAQGYVRAAAIYTEASASALAEALAAVDKSSQSAVNKSYSDIKAAMAALSVNETLKFGTYSFENSLASDDGMAELDVVTSNIAASNASASYTDGGAVAFDGSYGLSLGGVGSEFTVSARVKVTNPQNATTIFFKNMGNNSSEKWVGIVSQSGYPAVWTHNGSDYKWSTVIKAAATTTDTWATYTYTEKDGMGTLYINGEKVGSGTVLTADSAQLYMAATYWTADALKGEADELKLYPRQLSDDEVAALYAGEAPAIEADGKSALVNVIEAAAGFDAWVLDDVAGFDAAFDAALAAYSGTDAAAMKTAADALLSMMNKWTELEVLGEYEGRVSAYISADRIKLSGADDMIAYCADYENEILDRVEISDGEIKDGVAEFDMGECDRVYLWQGMKPVTSVIKR